MRRLSNFSKSLLRVTGAVIRYRRQNQPSCHSMLKISVITERHLRRLLRTLQRRGDQAVIHALRGEPSNRRIAEEVKEKAGAILSQEVYRGFRRTFGDGASEPARY